MAVPADLSVVGFDDTETAAATTPPLTTVHQPMEAKGEAAAQLLLDGAPTTDLVLPTELIVRGYGPAAGLTDDQTGTVSVAVSPESTSPVMVASCSTPPSSRNTLSTRATCGSCS